MKKARVQWYISGDVECPHCEHEYDFMEEDEFWVFSNVGENKEKFIHPIKHTCDNCKKEFEIDGSDH